MSSRRSTAMVLAIRFHASGELSTQNLAASDGRRHLPAVVDSGFRAKQPEESLQPRFGAGVDALSRLLVRTVRF